MFVDGRCVGLGNGTCDGLVEGAGVGSPWVLALAAMSVSARAQASAEASAEAQGTALAWA